MSDYTRSKPRITKGHPQRTSPGGVSGFTQVEAFLTPEKLKAEFLFGVPLVSPLTKQELSDDAIKSIINRAAARVEMKCRVDIFPKQHTVRIEYDRTKYYQGWGQLNLGYPNIKSVEEVSIRTVDSKSFPGNAVPTPGTEDGKLIYNLPLAWLDIDTAGFKGIIHMVPLQTAFSGTGIVAGQSYNGAAAAILTVFMQSSWIPGFWYAKFTTGFDTNGVPSTINQLIGLYAAMEILSQLSPTQKYNSKSIGIDGTSQSLGGSGNQLFLPRINDIKEQILDLQDMIKKYYGAGIIMTHF